VNIKGELSVKKETGTRKSCPFILGDYMFHHLFVVLTNNIFLCLTRHISIIIQVLSFVNVWRTMGLLQILSLISPRKYMKELFLPQKKSPLFKELAILHLSLDPSLLILTWEDTGQLQCSTESISL
jgi:hypothetical protein